jgi:toxin ParE1/3/4
MLKVVYHPEAEAELIEAARYYEQKVTGLGADFLDEVDRGVQLILRAPFRWRVIEEDIRRYCIRRFPYGVIYRMDSQMIRILALKHHSRQPGYWKYRE